MSDEHCQRHGHQWRTSTVVTFCIGIAMLVNGLFFSVRGKTLPESSPGQGELDAPQHETNDLLMPPTAQKEFRSVTENTTRTLKDKKPASEE